VVGLTTESMMTNSELQAWAMKAWEKEVIQNSPAAKAGRSLRANLARSRKDMARARRSLASSQAASKRKLGQRQADIAQEFRDRREASDREFEERRWDLIMGKK